MEEIIRKKICFYGYVQGVGFRYYAKHMADHLRLTGWVKNRFDGSVELEVQGAEGAIDQLIFYLDSRPHIQIQSMDVKKIPIDEKEYGFYEQDSDSY